MQRREFLRKTTSAAAGAIVAPYLIPSGVLATQERPGIADPGTAAPPCERGFLFSGQGPARGINVNRAIGMRGRPCSGSGDALASEAMHPARRDVGQAPAAPCRG